MTDVYVPIGRPFTYPMLRSQRRTLVYKGKATYIGEITPYMRQVVVVGSS